MIITIERKFSCVGNSYEEFASFLRENLLQLVREKTIRALQRKSLNQSSLESLHAFTHGINDELRNKITVIDPSHTGHVSFDDLCHLLQTFIGDSEILLDLISSEIDISKGANVYYVEVLPQISRLLEVD